MKRFLNAACLLFYLLAIIDFFFIGVGYAVLSDAGKNQGLAGGAIVFMYGVYAAFFAWLVSIAVVYLVPHKTIVLLNKILGCLTLILVLFLVYLANR